MRRHPWLVITLVLGVVALGVGGLWLRRHLHVRNESRERHEEVARGPRLRVAQVKNAPAVRELTLPADVRGILQATLYSKTAGYLERITVYGGDRVKKGQLLAVIASPETDQQVAEARADLIFKDKTAQRARLLASRDFIARQDLDQAESALRVSRATLSRLRSLQGYQVLRAPFDGVVTYRYVDQGALIPAAATPVVDVANLSRVRVLVAVAQDAAPFLHVGDPGIITVDERPGEKINASVTRFGPALDPRSRSMLAELWLDNAGPRLYPGTYVKVTLQLAVPPLPQVPSAAVSVRGGKLTAGVVENGRVRLVPVTTGLDDGRTVQVKTGLREGQTVVLNLPPEIADQAAIQPVAD
jgi:RND family efflux transporter MFP subunit